MTGVVYQVCTELGMLLVIEWMVVHVYGDFKKILF